MFTPTFKYAIAHLKKERIRSDAGLIVNKNVSVGKNFFAIGFHITGVSSLTRRQWPTSNLPALNVTINRDR